MNILQTIGALLTGQSASDIQAQVTGAEATASAAFYVIVAELAGVNILLAAIVILLWPKKK